MDDGRVADMRCWWKWISLLSELLPVLRNVIDSVRDDRITNHILRSQPPGLVASLFIQSSGEKAREQGPEDENLKKTSSTRPWGPLLLLTNNTSQGPIQVYPVPGRDYSQNIPSSEGVHSFLLSSLSTIFFSNTLSRHQHHHKV